MSHPVIVLSTPDESGNVKVVQMSHNLNGLGVSEADVLEYGMKGNDKIACVVQVIHYKHLRVLPAHHTKSGHVVSKEYLDKLKANCEGPGVAERESRTSRGKGGGGRNVLKKGLTSEHSGTLMAQGSDKNT